MNPGNDNPAARAEFYLCLARAFLPPHTENNYRALAVYLADDLADLAGETGYPISEPLAQLRAAFGALPEPLALLQLYSKLFLTPPMPVALNTGRYLDGAVMGGSVQAIEGWYRRCGLERTESFHDLPDHVTLQLEFVARLFAGAAAAHQTGENMEAQRLDAEARAFLGTFVTRWLPGFCAALERTHAKHRLPTPYLHLTHILCAAVECDAMADAPRTAAAPATSATAPGDVQEAQVPRETGMSEAAVALGGRSRRRPTSFVPEVVPPPSMASSLASSTVTPIAASGPTPAQLQEIARALAAHGQSTEHLGVPLAARDAALGLARLTPPDPKRSRSG